jgi:hypothetical protein
MNDLVQLRIQNILFIISVTLLAGLTATGCDNITSTEEVKEERLDVERLAMNSATNLAVETTDGFYFLPPLIKKPDYSGSFDPDLSPIVEICETTECDEIHKTYSMTEGEGSETIRVDPEDEHYIVNWHTDKTGTQIGQTYRIRVSFAGVQLGYANITMAENGKEARNATTDGAIGLVDGRTLPIKFRIETGIVGTIEVTPAEASVAVGETQQYTAALYDLHGELITGPEIEWSSEDTEIATADEDGLATGIAPGEIMILATSGPAVDSTLLTVKNVGVCTSGASGNLALRFQWKEANSKAYVYDYERDDLPGNNQSVSFVRVYSTSSLNYTPFFVDDDTGAGGVELTSDNFMDIRLSTEGLTEIRNVSIAILGRSFNYSFNGSFSWQSFIGNGAAPSGSIRNTTPYKWTVVSAPNSLIVGQRQTLLRIRSGPPSNQLVVNKVEICFDAD